MKTIGYLWHSFYSGNLGVSALSDANVQIVMSAINCLETDADVKHIFFGPKGDRGFKIPKDIDNIEYIEVSSISKFYSIRKRLIECDLVLDIGSGDSFSDIYGFKRFLKICGLKLITPNAKKKLFISPQTLGPFNSWWSKFLSKIAFTNAYKIFTRDEMSRLRVQNLLPAEVSNEIVLTTDVAFSLRKLDYWPPRFPLVDNDKLNIGINVSGLLYTGGYSGRNQFELSLNYADLISSVVSFYESDKNVQVWLIPHVYQIEKSPFESDLEVSLALAKRHTGVKLAPIFYDAREAKTFISQMDIVFAARMHAAIAAVSSGTACIPMSYSVKFQGLFNSINYSHTLDMKKSSSEEAIKIINNAVENRKELELEAKISSQIANEKLKVYKDAIFEFIEGMPENG